MNIFNFSDPQLLFGMPGGTELLLILLVILLFFGGKKIPGLMRGLGRSVREFNDAREGKSGAEEEHGKRQSGVKESIADASNG